MDADLVPSADYEAALLVAVPINPLPRLERLAGRCLFRLIEKTAADGSGSSGGVLPVVSRAIGQPLEELLAMAVLHDVPSLPANGQVLLLEAVATWADGFTSHAAARRRSAAALIRGWTTNDSDEVSLEEMENKLAAAGVTKRGARALFEQALGPDAASARMRDAYALATALERPTDVAAEGKDSNMESDVEWLARTARVGSRELAEVLVPRSEWAFLAELDPRSVVMWRIARRLATRELQHEDGVSAPGTSPELWNGDALGLLAELLGMERGGFVEEAGRLLSIETLRLSCCAEPTGGEGKRGKGRRGLLRTMGAAIAAESRPLRTWRKAVTGARQIRHAEESRSVAPDQGAVILRVSVEQQASLAAYDGDGARPLGAKAMLPQIIALYQVIGILILRVVQNLEFSLKISVETVLLTNFPYLKKHISSKVSSQV